MTYILGLDTGGTFTDAAVINSTTGKLIAKAKAPTTRHDLGIGLAASISKALAAISKTEHGKISRVCLSTTLATNAVVEGVGGRAALVMIGFDETALERNNLKASLGDDPAVFISGGHKNDGRPIIPLDEAALKKFAQTAKTETSAIAIAGHFATRNPEHEIKARDILRKLTGLPVTCSFELSESLGGPKRALTALLNARLINLLAEQIAALDGIIKSAGLKAEQMVVKGDGSLISAELARIKPVETILSGPAASLTGAAHLLKIKDAVIADIGGTTTDIAVLENGLPRLSPHGARIGGWATMVEAADISTSGLGGDSEARAIAQGTGGGVSLGPRRVIPLSVAATDDSRVLGWLEDQMQNPIPSASDGRFVAPLFSADNIPQWLTRSEAKMAQHCLEKQLSPIADIAQTQLALGAIDRLVARGLVALSAMTPTDAALVLGLYDAPGIEAARLGASLLARQRTGKGLPQAPDGEAMARMVLEALTTNSSLALVDAAIMREHPGITDSGGIFATMIAEGAAAVHGGKNTVKKNGIVDAQVKLRLPLIALGASAHCHYPAVAKVLGAKLTVPEDADVAGAVGAAASSVRQRASVTITQPGDGVFRVHAIGGPQDFSTVDDAITAAESHARDIATRKADAAGAGKITLTSSHDIKTVALGEKDEMFIEGIVHVFARAG